jgi:Xaa-Pro dipeptidase
MPHSATTTLGARLGAPPPLLPERLIALLEAEVPRFSKPEIARRRRAIAQALEEAGARHGLLLGGDRRASPLQWITGWPASGNNIAVFSGDARDVLLVPYPNHAPLARILAAEADVVWGPEGAQALAIAELEKRGATGQKVGVVGGMSHALFERLAKAGMVGIDLGRAYTRLRLIKSEEEIDWMRIGCALSDLGVEALGRDAAPGMNEHELQTIIERAYMPWGGLTQIHFVGVTPMADPDCIVPFQIPRNRIAESGDIIFTEIAAGFWGYPGQILRSFTLAADPTPLYRDLHAVAEACFHAVLKVLRAGAEAGAVLDAAACIARSGFAVCDDLLHGYGGGYLPPILGTHERPSGPLPDFPFAENMTVVVQPSIVTKDGKAGVQCGELVRITRDGVERLHQAPWGFRRIG